MNTLNTHNNDTVIPLEFCDYNITELNSVLIHLFGSMQTLANVLESARPDITTTIDSIIDHPEDDIPIDVLHNQENGKVGNLLIAVDRKKRKFHFIREGKIDASIQAYDLQAPKDSHRIQKAIQKAVKK